jgi:hypothetical protein
MFGTINTNVDHLLSFRPIQKISIKYISLFSRKDIPKKFNLLQQPITHSFFEKTFASYEYVGFQFSKHDEYGENICISKFQLCCLQKNL